MDVETKHILTAPNVVCPECGSKLFTENVVLKKISPIISPTGREDVIPIPVFACAKCGAIPEEYMSKPNAKYIFGEAEPEENSEEQPASGIIMP